MADTQRTASAAIALLADNNLGAISAQDLRDAFVTWRPRHGQIYVAAAGAAAITIANTTDYVEATAPAWTPDAGDQYDFDESDGNGRLTYTGTADIMVHCAATISFQSGSNNQVLSWRIGVNGTTKPASEVQNKLAIGADVQSTAMHWVGMLSTGDHISVFVRNTTGANNVTLVVANIQLMSMPCG